MQLPPPLDRLLAGLEPLVPATEPLAACASCVMAEPAAPGRPVFTAPARCCTHHPELPNFLVSHALDRGGVGAERIRARLQDPSGVGPLGVDPSDSYRARRVQVGYSAGQDPGSTCPYWVEGDLGCSIHLSRNAICRTWFCRMGHGKRSYDTWMAARDVIRAAERRIARAVAHEPGDDWSAYFQRCSARARSLDDAALTDALDLRLLARCQDLAAARDEPLPLCPVPSISGSTIHPTHVELESFSSFDPFFAPPWIFQLLSRLDGQTPWLEALRATAAIVEGPVSPDLVLQLWNRGLLAPPEALQGDGFVL